MATTSNTTEYCLRWISYEPNAAQFFSSIYEKEALTDVTLVSHEGNQIKAHKLVLAACSPYFLSIFENAPMNTTHPVVVLKDISFVDLQSVICFIYKGVVNVPHERITSVVLAATSLQVKGLSSSSSNSKSTSYSHPPRPDLVRGASIPAAVPKPEVVSFTPEILDQPSAQQRTRPKISSSDSVNKSDNDNSNSLSFYEPDQRVSMVKKSETVEAVKVKKDEDLDRVNSSNEFPGSRLHEALVHQGGSSAVDEFQNLDFDPSLRNVKVEEEFPDDFCEVAFEEDSDSTELMNFGEESSLGDLLLPSTSTSAQNFLSNGEMVLHSSPGLNSSPLNPQSVSSRHGEHKNKLTSKSSLGSKNTRKGNRRFKCDTCGAEYTCLSHLIRHRLVHADPRFQCEFCSRCFTRKDVLTRHLKEVHYMKCRKDR